MIAGIVLSFVGQLTDDDYETVSKNPFLQFPFTSYRVYQRMYNQEVC